ncbi:LOW QUALITY PROTEIN: sulfotransferase 2A1-like [Trichechus inunguis]
MASDYLWFEGIPFPHTGYRIEDIRSIRDEFVVRDEDVITLSYSKSGTNWVIEIVSTIHTNGDPSWVQSVAKWFHSQWIETSAGYECVKNMKEPRFYTSHLPSQLFPMSFFNSKAKVIYLDRNPRDVLTSGFYYWRAIKYTRTPETFEQYFEWFLQRNVTFGSWFDHIHGWLQMREKENFLMISYEELYQDIRAGVEKISQFLGKKLGPEEFNSVLQVMKNNKMSNLSLVPDSFM